MSVQKTYPIPVELLQAAFGLIERMPASREVRAVLNGLEAHVTQHDKDVAEAQGRPGPVMQGGGGPGSDDPPVKK